MLSHKRTIRIDVVSSFVSFITSFAFLTYFGLGPGSIFLGVVVFLVGILRGEPAPSGIWAKTFTLIAPYGVFVLGAMNGVYHLFFLGVICVLGSFLGVITRRAFMNRRKAIFGLTPIYLVSLFFYGTCLLPKFEDSMMWREIDKPLPDFKLLSLSEDTLYSKKIRGKILVIDFWATWCGPCKDELPELEKLYNKYKSNDRVMFLAIDSDKRDDLEKIKVFVNKTHYQLPFFIDLPEKLAKKYDVGGLPTVLMVDSKGVVRFEHVGYSDVENFETEFDKRISVLLGQP